MSALHFRIRIGALHPGSPIPFDIFIQINDKHVHYLRAGNLLRADRQQALDTHPSACFFVPEDQRATYQKYMTEQFSSPDLSTADKAKLLRESSIALVEEVFESPDVGKALDAAKPVVDQFIEFMSEQPDGAGHLLSLSGHDFYTYNHSLDVGLYSLALGRIAGYSGAELTELGRGALFHDIGKRQVPTEIICKKGGLSDLEWAEMRQHPLYGLKILNTVGASDEIKACCFEHHENFMGNGYPQQLPGEEIHPMARIIAITDTYDALTTKRSYNKPMAPRDAVQFMTGKLADKYDPSLLKAMNDVLFEMESTQSAPLGKKSA